MCLIQNSHCVVVFKNGYTDGETENNVGYQWRFSLIFLWYL